MNDFDIGRCLGKGSFGAVYVARERDSRFVLSLKTADLMQQLCREIDIQFHLRHPNIVELYSYFYDHKRIYLMFEFIPKGDLEHELSHFQYFSDARTATYLFQLASAINYFHDKHIIHRDIKASNVLIGAKGQIKITDFGQSIHRPSSKRNKFVGTIDYIPPEIAFCTDDQSKNAPYDQSVDIWSLGILSFFMLTGDLPFAKLDAATTINYIQNCKIIIPDRISNQASNLIHSMLRYEPKDRLKASEIVNHPWLVTYAEKSLNQCQAALDDWDALKNSLHNSFPNSGSFNLSSFVSFQSNCSMNSTV